jgi:large subunit ribosomal protein L21
VDFAIIETGGKQYKVSPNQYLKIEKLDGIKGDKIVFDKVLLIAEGDNVQIGQPYLADVTIEAQVLDQLKTKKLRVMKFKAKSRYRRTYGHRQNLTQVQVKTDKKPKTKAPAKKPLLKLP